MYMNYDYKNGNKPNLYLGCKKWFLNYLKNVKLDGDHKRKMRSIDASYMYMMFHYMVKIYKLYFWVKFFKIKWIWMFHLKFFSCSWFVTPTFQVYFINICLISSNLETKVFKGSNFVTRPSFGHNTRLNP